MTPTGPATQPHAALLTDLYELTMAYGYWKQGMATRRAAFYWSFREHPFDGNYTVFCGLETLCEMLQDYRFRPDDVAYLATLNGADGGPLFAREFLEYLAQLQFSCDIDAVAEGTLVFPHAPLVRVCGPLLQAQIIESLLLNVLNFQTLVATKAARICRAAAPGAVLEFGLRRAQGDNGAVAASRAAYIGGCAGTSNVLAGQRYGIPVRGTHAHSWVMSFDSELEAFEKYAEALPNNCIFLVDTYDTPRGVRNAVEVARQMRAAGHAPIGIRLDSGDLAALSRQARQMLDAAGLENTKIVVSNDLDEYAIAQLKAEHAPIDVWGVGTRLATAYDQPALGGVYKLSALQDETGRWQPKLKLSEEPIKISTPGILQTRRYARGTAVVADVVYDIEAGVSDPVVAVGPGGSRTELPGDATHTDLLQGVFRAGTLVHRSPPIDDLRAHAAAQLACFADYIKEAPGTASYPVVLERHVHEQKQQLVGSVKEDRS